MKKVFLVAILVVSTLFANPMKKEIFNSLHEEFQSDFGVWNVDLDNKDLSIRFENIGMLYAKGHFNIRKSFQLILKDFIPRYISILKKYDKDIDKVYINGYTSSENRRGKTAQEKYQYNLVLSQKRADGVLDFIKTFDKDKDFIANKFVAIGKSSSKLIYKENGEEDKLKSRRIEFKIKFLGDKNKVEQSLLGGSTNPHNDLKTLYHYVQRLVKENPTLKKQLALLKSTKEDIEKSKAAFRPTLDLNYNYKKYLNYNYTKNPDKSNDQSVDLTLQYNLFNGFKDQDQLDISKSNYTTTKYTQEQVENDLIYSLIDAYVSIKKIKDVYKLSKENYKDYNVWVEKEKIRFQNGVISLRDFKKVEARAITRYMNFEEDTKNYNDSISKMQSYLNFDDQEIKFFKIENPQNKYFNNIDLGLKDIVKYSPYIKEAVNNITLYKLKMKAAKVTFYPNVNLIGKSSASDANYKDTTNDTTTIENSIVLEAKMNLYAGGADQADYQKKFFDYKQKVAKKDEVIRDTKYKLDLAYNKYFMLKSKIKSAKEVITTREDEYVAANYDFKFGKINANDLLDVTDEVYNAKKQYIKIKYDLILAKYEILKNLGLEKAYILGKI